MRRWNRFGVAALFGVWLAACARVDDSPKDAGSSGRSAAAGASVGGLAGVGGAPTSDVVLMPDAGRSGSYPPPFDASTCPTPVPTGSFGSISCMTRAQLADSRWLHLALDAGVSALGPADAWRCPDLKELLLPGECGGERCCYFALCGPLIQHNSTASSGASGTGAGGAGDAGTEEQTCCYYVEEQCGV
jgi:hypothetical protein